jgi:hypothetical protein
VGNDYFSSSDTVYVAHKCSLPLYLSKVNPEVLLCCCLLGTASPLIGSNGVMSPFPLCSLTLAGPGRVTYHLHYAKSRALVVDYCKIEIII